MSSIARLVSLMVRLVVVLALAGQLKSCTLMMMGHAVEKAGRGVMSYSKFSRMLTD